MKKKIKKRILFVWTALCLLMLFAIPVHASTHRVLRGNEITLSFQTGSLQNIRWSVQDTNILSIENTGYSSVIVGGSPQISYNATLKGLSVGTTMVYSYDESGDTLASAEVSVIDPAVDFKLNYECLFLSVGDSVQLEPTEMPEGTSLIWSCNNSYTHVDSKGVVTVSAPYNISEITCRTSDGLYKATCTVIGNIPTYTPNCTLVVGKSKTLTYSIPLVNWIPAVNGKWSSSNPRVATVDSQGTVYANAAGSANITAEIGNQILHYLVQVHYAEPTVTPTPIPSPSPGIERPVLTGKSMKWISRTSAEITAVSTKDGYAYAEWAVKGSKAPAMDCSGQGQKIFANTQFTMRLDGFDPDQSISIYLRVKDKEGNLSEKKMLFNLSDAKRPTDTMPTPNPGRQPKTPKVTESKVIGLSQPLKFYPKIFYKFTVIGAGTDNKAPIKGDVRWVPLYWATSPNPSNKQTNWKIGTTKGIEAAGVYNLYVFFRKDIHDGESWQTTDTIQCAIFQFRSAELLPKVSVKKLTISKISQKTYNGKALKPSIKIKYKGKTLKNNTDYTLSYKNNIKPGKAKCIIKGKGRYSGTKTIYFNISPSKQKITYLKSTKSKTATIKFKKAKGQSGVQICYSKNSRFKNPKYSTTTGGSKKITKLSKKKTYYFKIRSYKTVSGKRIYGPYSSVKKVKIK